MDLAVAVVTEADALLELSLQRRDDVMARHGPRDIEPLGARVHMVCRETAERTLPAERATRRPPIGKEANGVLPLARAHTRDSSDMLGAKLGI
jgi:hypothetical protein